MGRRTPTQFRASNGEKQLWIQWQRRIHRLSFGRNPEVSYLALRRNPEGGGRKYLSPVAHDPIGASLAAEAAQCHRDPMEDLLRYNDTRRRDPRIDAWFAVIDPHRFMVQPWFQRMRDCGDDVRELFHDGCPIACVGDAPFGYVNAFKSHANVGFYHGAALRDPASLLEGHGKHMRHVKLRPGEELNAEALADLIAAAYADIRHRLSGN